MARPTAVPDILDGADDDLLPGPATPRDEATDADAQAISRIESATGATSDGVKAPKAKEEKPRPIRAKRPSLPAMPLNLDEAVMTFPVKLKNVYFGKSITNVVASLKFDVLVPQDFREVLGEHAFTASFLGGLLGYGVEILDAPLKKDQENRQQQVLDLRIPRFADPATDQLLTIVAPLVGGRKFIEALFGMDWPWGVNVKVDIDGEISLYAMQQSLALTDRATDTIPTDETREPVDE